MSLNIINIGEKELCSAMRSLVDFGKENCNCNADEVASDNEGCGLRLPGCECDATDNLVKINERLENIASDITSNKEINVRLDDDLRGLSSNVGENSENIEKLEKRMTDIENLINEIQSGSNATSSNLNTEIMLIKAEYETRAMDMKSYLDMVGDRVNDIENRTNDKFSSLQIEASNKLDNVEVSLNENITTLRTYIDDLVMGIRTFLNKLEKELDRSSDQNENIENLIGGVSRDTILNSEEINNLKKVVQSYKDENSRLSERINNLVAANINRNLTPRHE